MTTLTLHRCERFDQLYPGRCSSTCECKAGEYVPVDDLHVLPAGGPPAFYAPLASIELLPKEG